MIVKRRTRGTNGIRPARLAEVSFQLHYAQTQRQSRCQIYTTTTWDYTTLKLPVVRPRLLIVLLPLGITLLSNQRCARRMVHEVLLPLGITLLSNKSKSHWCSETVLLPLGITLLSNPHVLRCQSDEVLLPLGITLLSNEHCDRQTGRVVLLPLGITLLSNIGHHFGNII